MYLHRPKTKSAVFLLEWQGRSQISGRVSADCASPSCPNRATIPCYWRLPCFYPIMKNSKRT
jgi:hypothetical protein